MADKTPIVYEALGTIPETYTTREMVAGETIPAENIPAGAGSGADGLSAYEIAVAGGFVGTEAAWLASLNGSDGVDGVNGSDGAAGVDGAQGIQGETGAQGIQGIQGVAGSDGAAGTNGVDGADGDSWETATVISQALAEAGTDTTPQIFSAERIAQAIAALGGGGSSYSNLFQETDTLYQRNGTVAQEYLLSNSYTDAANYSRAYQRFSGNDFETGVEAGGTGVAGDYVFNSIIKADLGVKAGNWLYLSGSNYSSGVRGVAMRNNDFRYGKSVGVGWSPSDDPAAGVDVGLIRDSAGMLKITDGGISYGSLMMKPPTSDPLVAGMLWNNAGTPTISAG